MATITITFGDEMVGEYELIQSGMTIGRDPSCTIPIDNLGISRQHCQFLKRGDVYIVQDMGSANGTYVNDKRVGEHYLNNADVVKIGKYSIRFNNEGQAEAQKREGGVAAAMASSEEPADGLRTYVMDGKEIQKKIAAMKAATAGGGGGAPKTAADYAKLSGGGGFGSKAAEAQEKDELAVAKRLQLVFLTWALIATALAVIFGMMVFSAPVPVKETPAPAPTEETAPADAPADAPAPGTVN
ncbi:MAG: FHA domain-containing protein [Planctomycetota bacterium]